MAWNPHDEPIDYVEIVGKRTPGLAVIEGAGLIFKWDQAQGYGLSGAFARFTGIELSEFTMRVLLWESEQWDEWAAMLPLLANAPMGVRPKSLVIWHPYLESARITQAVVKKILQPKPVFDGTAFELPVEFLQYRRPKAQYSAPKEAPTTVTDPVSLEIARMTDQLSRGGAQGYLVPTGGKAGSAAMLEELAK